MSAIVLSIDLENRTDFTIFDTDGVEYKVVEFAVDNDGARVYIEPEPTVYVAIRMSDGPRPEHVNVYEVALIEHEGDVTKALAALYDYLMQASHDTPDSGPAT